VPLTDPRRCSHPRAARRGAAGQLVARQPGGHHRRRAGPTLCGRLEALSQDRESAILFIHAPTAIVPSADIAQALLPRVTQAPRRVLGCWLGDTAVVEARRSFRDAGVPDFDTPEQAVRAFGFLRTYRLHQEELLQTPPVHGGAPASDLPRIRASSTTVAQGRELLTEPEAKDLLDAAGLPVVPTRIVGCDVAEAEAAAEALGYPVVLKILSEDISHKSDVGGVRLNIGSAPSCSRPAWPCWRGCANSDPRRGYRGSLCSPWCARSTPTS
jgi:acyl-CoA synthetase (NDP forming)